MKTKGFNMKKKIIIMIGLAALCGMAQAALVISSSTTNWNPISYGSNIPDPSSDQSTGQADVDLVGNATHASFYTQFDGAGTPALNDGTWAFRSRHAADKNPPGYDKYLFIGLDANADGALDLYVGFDGSSSKSYVRIYGAGAGQVSPGTVNIGAALYSYAATASNFSWTAVTAVINPIPGLDTDLDNLGDNDYFLSFALPFNDIVNALFTTKGITITENSAVSFVAATSTQANKMNQDYLGINDKSGYNPTNTFSQLGVISTATPPVIPEPATVLLFGVGGMGAWLLRRTNQQKDEEDADA
jgi:hypothetical protein